MIKWNSLLALLQWKMRLLRQLVSNVLIDIMEVKEGVAKQNIKTLRKLPIFQPLLTAIQTSLVEVKNPNSSYYKHNLALLKIGLFLSNEEGTSNHGSVTKD
jgi:hypothetical protein